MTEEMIEKGLCRKFLVGSAHGFAHFFYFAMKDIIDRHGEEGWEFGRQIVRRWANERGRLKREALKARGLDNTPENYWEEPHPNTLMFNQSDSLYQVYTEDEIVKQTHYCAWEDAFTLRPDKESQKIKELYCQYVDADIWKTFNPDYEVTRLKTFARDGVCCIRFARKK
jgi:hypothetical protein